MCCKHVRGTLLLEGLFYMSYIEALHHLNGTRCQELHLCWKQLKVTIATYVVCRQCQACYA